MSAQLLSEDTMVFIPSFGRVKLLMECIKHIRANGHGIGDIHVICHQTLEPKLTVPGVTFYRIQKEGWTEGKAFAACMVLAKKINPFFKHLIIIDDDTVINSPEWTKLPDLMDQPENEHVYAATACGNMRAFLGQRIVKQLLEDGVSDTSISCGLIIVKHKSIEQAGIFAPAPCRTEYEYKIRLAMIGKVFVCFNITGFHHYRSDTGGTNRLFPVAQTRVQRKRKAFWRFIRNWTQHWKAKSDYIFARENILAKADNRFSVHINFARIARFRRGSITKEWMEYNAERLNWRGTYTKVFIQWLKKQAPELL